MSLSKKQMVVTASSATFVLAAGVLGWFLYDAWTVRGEQEDELVSQQAALDRYYGADVFPSQKTIADVRTNQAALAAWRAEAQAFAARGDKAPVTDSPPIFKQRLATAVTKMRSLPGGADGKIAVPTFLFGFDAYLGEGGVLPDEKDVPRLARQLDAVAHMVVTLVKAGAVEVKEVRRIEPAPETENADAKKKKAKAKKAEANAPKSEVLEYAWVFTARPDAVVKTLNALAADTRFITVKRFAFHPVEDDIVNRLDALAQAKAQGDAAKASSGGRRRRRAAAEEPAETAAEPAQKGPVADPEFGSPLLVELTLSVRDFGTAAVSAN